MQIKDQFFSQEYHQKCYLIFLAQDHTAVHKILNSSNSTHPDYSSPQPQTPSGNFTASSPWLIQTTCFSPIPFIPKQPLILLDHSIYPLIGSVGYGSLIWEHLLYGYWRTWELTSIIWFLVNTNNNELIYIYLTPSMPTLKFSTGEALYSTWFVKFSGYIGFLLFSHVCMEG